MPVKKAAPAKNGAPAKKAASAAVKAEDSALKKKAKFSAPGLKAGDSVILSYSEELTRKSGKEDWDEYIYGRFRGTYRGRVKKNGKEWLVFRMRDGDEEWDTLVDPQTGVCASGLVLDSIVKGEPPAEGRKAAAKPAPAGEDEDESEDEGEDESEDESEDEDEDVAYTL